MNEMNETHVITSMSDDELRKFVDDVLSARIFLDVYIRDGTSLTTIFMPLIFGIFEGWSKEELAKVGVIYEYYDQALRMGINGYPMFMSLRLLNSDDWTRAQEALVRETKRRKEIEV